MSYCHADQRRAAWLHRALESYRVPRRLVGTTGLFGALPRRLAPIFRDREDLSSAADLSETIKQALADSESLIVICSPGAAQSRWVNEEIRHFRSLGKGSRIHCVIVDGDPLAADSQQACFPPALTEGLDGRAREPLAADIRNGADGRHLAKLKLTAGILGVGLDELRRRDKQRQRKLHALAGIATLAVVVLLVYTLQSRVAERDAHLAREAQQESAEAMLAKFLEQAARLSDVADIETRKAFGEVLSNYLADLDPSELTIESRRQLGVALSNRGVILGEEGQLEEAMAVFESARHTLRLLVDESHGDAEALFELSQVEYWIGQVHLDLGQMDKAGDSFTAYAEVSTSLHELQPENADWTMEAAYALSNLGNLESRKIPSNPELVLNYQQSALEFNEQAAKQDGKYEYELAESHAYLADAWLGVCDMGKASEHRLKNVELAEKYYRLNPGSNRLKQDYAYALAGLSRVHQKAGRIEPAMATLRQTLELQQELVDEDPSNLWKRWVLMEKSAFQAQVLDLAGMSGESWKLSQEILAAMKELEEQEQDVRIDHAMVFGMFLRDLAHRIYHRDDSSMADQLMGDSINRLRMIATENPNSLMVLNELALSYFYYWDHNQAKLPDASATDWLSRVREVLNGTGCIDLDIASRQAVMEGDIEQARQLVSRLIGQGYLEPYFMRFCLEHDLCTASG